MTTEITVGDKIKALDFPGIEDCYMTGSVLEIYDDMLICHTLSIVRYGVETPITNATSKFRTAKQGIGMMDDKCERITKI